MIFLRFKNCLKNAKFYLMKFWNISLIIILEFHLCQFLLPFQIKTTPKAQVKLLMNLTDELVVVVVVVVTVFLFMSMLILISLYLGLCKFFLNSGRCPRPESCPFSHQISTEDKLKYVEQKFVRRSLLQVI